jgi:hypothetical protein
MKHTAMFYFFFRVTSRNCSPFITMQWRNNQLSNNGNLAIYLSIASVSCIHLSVPRILWMWKLFTFFLHAVFRSFLQNETHGVAPLATSNVICLLLFAIFFFCCCFNSVQKFFTLGEI